MSHELGLAGYAEPALGSSRISLASVGLYTFFALSGYLVFKSLERNPRLSRFLIARALRIYPGSFVNVLFCVGLGAMLTTSVQGDFWSSSPTWAYLAHNAAIVWTPTELMLPGVFQASRWPVVNGSIWTIKYELLCYMALLIACGLLPLRIVSRQLLLIVATSLLISGYIYRTSNYGIPEGEAFFVTLNAFNLLRFFMVFCAGATYAACEPMTESTRLAFLSVPAALVTLGPTQPFAKAGVILLITLLVIEVGRTPVFFSRNYRRIGDLSYGTFLYAYPVQNLVTTRFFNGHNFAAVTATSFVVILLCAFLSWQLVERPALRLKDRLASTSLACAQKMVSPYNVDG